MLSESQARLQCDVTWQILQLGKAQTRLRRDGTGRDIYCAQQNLSKNATCDSLCSVKVKQGHDLRWRDTNFAK